MSHITLLRHGQSVWNRERRFTGWSNVPLSDVGRDEARRAGEQLRAAGLRYDCAFTSALDRGEETLRIVLETLGQTRIPVDRSWRLNERHFGRYQGLSRQEAVLRFGPFKVMNLQRSFDVAPPRLDERDLRNPHHDPLYAELAHENLPMSESLAETCERIRPYWDEQIAPQLRKGSRVLVVAHKNSLRALVRLIEQIPDQEVPKLKIRTGQPLVYELDGALRVVAKRSQLAA